MAIVTTSLQHRSFFRVQGKTWNICECRYIRDKSAVYTCKNIHKHTQAPWCSIHTYILHVTIYIYMTYAGGAHWSSTSKSRNHREQGVALTKDLQPTWCHLMFKNQYHRASKPAALDVDWFSCLNIWLLKKTGYNFGPAEYAAFSGYEPLRLFWAQTCWAIPKNWSVHHTLLMWSSACNGTALVRFEATQGETIAALEACSSRCRWRMY